MEKEKKQTKKKNDECVYAIKDWAELKLRFFQSKHVVLTDFIKEINQTSKEKIRGYTGQFGKKTKGWASEKRKYLEDITNEAIKQMKKEVAKSVAIDLDDIRMMKKNALELAKINMIHNFNKSQKKTADGKTVVVDAPDMRDIERVYKMARTELGENTEKIDHTTGGMPFGAIQIVVSDDTK